jgi:hypothetical protein
MPRDRHAAELLKHSFEMVGSATMSAAIAAFFVLLRPLPHLPLP